MHTFLAFMAIALKWNSQLAMASWRQRERWHHWRISLLCGSGV